MNLQDQTDHDAQSVRRNLRPHAQIQIMWISIEMTEFTVGKIC